MLLVVSDLICLWLFSIDCEYKVKSKKSICQAHPKNNFQNSQNTIKKAVFNRKFLLAWFVDRTRSHTRKTLISIPLTSYTTQPITKSITSVRFARKISHKHPNNKKLCNTVRIETLLPTFATFSAPVKIHNHYHQLPHDNNSFLTLHYTHTYVLTYTYLPIHKITCSRAYI